MKFTFLSRIICSGVSSFVIAFIEMFDAVD